MSQNGKNGEPHPKGSDAIDDDDDERIVQTLLVEAVERRQRPYHALTQRQGKEDLLSRVRPNLQLQQP